MLQRLVMSIAVVSFASFANAQTPKFEVELSYDDRSYELTAKIKETETSMNACDLVVSRMEYMKDLAVLNVELAADFCPMDIVGQRQSVVKWHLPRPLRAKGGLKLRVNGEVLGEIQIDRDKAGFEKAPVLAPARGTNR